MTTQTQPITETSTTQPKNRKWLSRGISLVIAAALIAFVLSLVDWADFQAVLSRLSPASLLGAFGVYLLLNWFRAVRYRVLLGRDGLRAWQIFPIGLAHNFLVRLLPFKLGEVSYIVWMRNRHDVTVSEGVSSLFGSRIFELLVIIIVAIGAILFSRAILPLRTEVLMLLLLVCAIGGSVGLYFSGQILRLGTRILRRLIPLKIVVTICDKFDQLAEKLDELRQPRIFSQALFWSCFTYLCSFGVIAILLFAVGLDVTAPNLILIVSLGMFASAFPFNISGFGAVELGFAFGLTTLAGYTTSEATSIGLMLNGYQLICAAISGALGYVYLQLRPTN